MKVKEFNDKYDKEFVNLMLEIDKRTYNFCKSDKLKLHSWVKALCFPTSNIPWKKNRNLYSILLLDSVLQGKLNPPFNKFLRDADNLEMISPSIVKSKLSNKFIKEINFNNTDEQIQNFINVHFSQIPSTSNNHIIHPYYQRINKSKNIVSPYKKHNKSYDFKYKQPITVPYKNNNIQHKQIYEPYNKHLYTKSNIVLDKTYYDICNKHKKCFHKKSHSNNKIDFHSIINLLQKEHLIKNSIITQQSKDIQTLKNKVIHLERKNFFSRSKKKQSKEAKILVLGLDNAGKSTILKAISGETAKNLPPTKGFNVKVIQKDSIKFTFWDVGGQKSLRNVWENYFESNDALIYVIDSSDTYRLEESGKELRILLEENQLSGIPLLIYANKQDLNLSLSPEEIMNELNLSNIINRKWTIVASSAISKVGLQDGICWLEKNLG